MVLTVSLISNFYHLQIISQNDPLCVFVFISNFDFWLFHLHLTQHQAKDKIRTKINTQPKKNQITNSRVTPSHIRGLLTLFPREEGQFQKCSKQRLISGSQDYLTFTVILNKLEHPRLYIFVQIIKVDKEDREDGIMVFLSIHVHGMVTHQKQNTHTYSHLHNHTQILKGGDSWSHLCF